MERFQLDAVQAFALLRSLSQISNTKLLNIAQRVVETGAGAASAFFRPLDDPLPRLK